MPNKLASIVLVAIGLSNAMLQVHAEDQLAGTASSDVDIRLAQALQPAPLEPAIRDSTSAVQQNATKPSGSKTKSITSIFGQQNQTDRSGVAGAGIIFGDEAMSRATADAGDLLRKTPFAVGVFSQQRTPVVNDTRVRGERVGQVLASGSYWFPARMDLDTMLNKIDSRLVDQLTVIKGPYAARFGPAFNFVDIQLRQTPRFENGFESHGSTSVTHKTNGEQWFGRQSVWAGNESWGTFVSYGHSLGNDFEDGNGQPIPASFKSRDVFAAFGWNPNTHSRFEFTYLRLDQTDVEFPGLVFDIDVLVTDGFELTYHNTDPIIGDEFFAEGWHNRTKFRGDSQGPGKDRLPALKTTFFSDDGASGAARTDVRAASSGYRADSTWYLSQNQSLTLGTDLLGLNQQLNDYDALLPGNLNNFPIPNSYMVDIGVFLEAEHVVRDRLRLRTGGRIDYVKSGADNIVQGVPAPISQLMEAELVQDHFLWSLFLTTEYDLTENWRSIANVGYAQRPPTLTELYATGPFIGTLQEGLTFIGGDPLLKPEQIKQFDLGVEYDSQFVSARATYFHAWIDDYIAFGRTRPTGLRGGLSTGVLLTNTDLVTLEGVDFQSAAALTSHIDGFASLSYIAGVDRTRERGPRRSPGPRSGVPGVPEEPLPGIPPLDAVVGLRMHDGTEQPEYWTEFQVRLVARQDKIAATLAEQATPGFAVWDVRHFWQVNDSLTMVGGIENFTDVFYFEHLDYRAGLGVFRPGISPYIGAEVTY